MSRARRGKRVNQTPLGHTAFMECGSIPPMGGTIWRSFKLFWDGLGHLGRVSTLVKIIIALVAGAMTFWSTIGPLIPGLALMAGAFTFAFVSFGLLVHDVRRATGPSIHRPSRVYHRQPMSFYFLPALLGSVGLILICVAGYWAHTVAFRVEDIAWEHTQPYEFFLYTHKDQGREVRIVEFRMRGRNQTNGPILTVSGHIRSDNNNDIRQIRFVVEGRHVEPSQTTGIVRDGQFQIASEPFNSPDPSLKGIPASQFLKEFGPFTFRFIYDGKSLEIPFKRDLVEREINRILASENPYRGVNVKP